MTTSAGGRPQREARHNGHLVRYTIAVLLNTVAEWAIFIGVLVYAFDRGGSDATGYAAVAMVVPYVICAPIAGSIAERYPAQRVRIGAMCLQTVAFALAATAAIYDVDTPLVVALTMFGIAGAVALGPSGAVLRPAIVRSSMELTVANLWTGYADSLSVLGGPLLATAMLLIGGAPAVIAGCAVTAALALLVSSIRRPDAPPGGSELTDRVGPIMLMRQEFRAVRDRPGIPGVMAVAGGQYFAVGALDVVIVVAAEGDLDLGPSGPGLLTAAFGLGAFLSGLVSTYLVRRRRLAPVIAISMVLTAAGAVVLGLTLSLAVAFLLLPLIGLTRSVQDLLGRMLLQRSADPHALASVFAVLELASGIGLIAGSLAAQVLISVGGVEAALVGIGAYFALLLAASGRSLKVADDSADVPVVAMSLLRRVPMFEPLPRPALEAVARSAVEIAVPAGTEVITQGEPGDRFYAVADGSFEIDIDGDVVDRIGRGSSFGEIALLANVPRAASVRSTSAGSLLAIERSPFLVAVTGHDSSRQAAWGVMHRLQGDDAPIDGPHQFATPKRAAEPDDDVDDR